MSQSKTSIQVRGPRPDLWEACFRSSRACGPSGLTRSFLVYVKGSCTVSLSSNFVRSWLCTQWPQLACILWKRRELRRMLSRSCKVSAPNDEPFGPVGRHQGRALRLQKKKKRWVRSHFRSGESDAFKEKRYSVIFHQVTLSSLAEGSRGPLNSLQFPVVAAQSKNERSLRLLYLFSGTKAKIFD